ncbi:hypothetical protein DERF_006645 [Dermatophagoides farinae]|uniref:Uncharacterized protein n=1 Tax=Dermatophagoides farinae TaxID=6954 RepID=A0A922I1S9_DERFA|nr:hypothetical protein DERF_006645 [Dermatophagoides farinae]
MSTSTLSMRMFFLAICLYGHLYMHMISCSDNDFMERLKVPPRFGKRQFDNKEQYLNAEKMFTNDMIEHRSFPIDQQPINMDTFQSVLCKMIIRQGQYYINLQCLNANVL